MRIKARGLAKSFEGKTVLAGASLSVEHPGIYALVGPNGSGKTTLMRILALLEKADAGRITFDGLEITNIKSAAAAGLRQRMVLVHSPAVMLSGSVRYNAGYGLRVRGLPPGQERSRISDLLEKLGLAGFENREARTLSSGEAQRLALARALAVDPEVIFLDEPTANLDPLSARLIEHSILELGRSAKAVVLASHNLWQVERLAEWIWFLNYGRIELSGPATQILSGAGHRLWSLFWGRDNLYSGYVEREEGTAVFKAGQVSFEVVSDLQGPATASLNPAEVILSREELHSSARNVKRGRVMEIEAESGIYRVRIDIGLPLVAMITKASGEELKLDIGSEVYAVFKASAVRVWREEL